MWETFLMAIGLMLIMEGILPFMSPRMWRETFKKMIEVNDGQLRFIGLSSMIFGLVILLIAS